MEDQDVVSQLKQYAFRALSQKQLSEHELRQRLTKRGALPEQSDEVIEMLKSYGYLNDQEVARTLAMKKGVGRGYIQQKLYEKGVEGNAKTLRDDDTEDQELQDQIDRHLAKWKRDGEKGFRRAVGFLVRRGFAYGKILPLLKASFQLELEGDTELDITDPDG